MDIDFEVANTNQRTPCILVLDASGSMQTEVYGGGTRISQLNKGLEALKTELMDDPTARSRVQLALVVVGGPSPDAEILMNWTEAREFQPMPIGADGSTALGKGLIVALDAVEQLKDILRQHGISYTRPWMMVITDGEPTDPANIWNDAVARCRDAEFSRKVQIWPIAVEGANISKLQEISLTPVKSLDGIKFPELFQWLSASLAAVTRSRAGDSLQLPSADPWSSVRT
ncbi:hypothetical protein G6658_03565 [Polynucleobacter paneuropaeus]|nr:hypothetical protein G6658_03565 [Polynucleobacter paneuropaeus]